jgi:hypothetical protein
MTPIGTDAGRSREMPPLDGWRVGLSISESPDLGQLGLGNVHLEDAFVRSSQHLLAAGAALAFGGDLRAHGFTEILFDLTRTHVQSGTSAFQRVHSFITWPLHLRLSNTQRAELKQIAQFHAVDPPADLQVSRNQYLEPNSPESRYIWARSLTAMRIEMNSFINARVLLGGQVRNYKGRYPGIAEEAKLAIDRGMPLFLIGGFGGCARVVADAVEGGVPEELTDAFQHQDEDYVKLRKLLAAAAIASEEQRVDYPGLVEQFKRCGFAGLRNGLAPEENQRLMITIDLDEIVYLLLKGLKSLTPR